MRLTTTCAICAFATAAAIGPALSPALAKPGDYFLKLGPVKAVLSEVEAGKGSATGKGHQEQIEIQSHSFGATRKGWGGTVNGGNVAETNGSAKFGAISGVKRNDSLAEPAARIAPPAAVSHDLRTNVVARIVARPAQGSITVDGDFPGCTVGTQYADAVLQVPGARYELIDVQITSCPSPASAMRSSMAGEYPRTSLSLNYKKIMLRGWDPEKKEE